MTQTTLAHFLEIHSEKFSRCLYNFLRYCLDKNSKHTQTHAQKNKNENQLVNSAVYPHPITDAARVRVLNL